MLTKNWFEEKKDIFNIFRSYRFDWAKLGCATKEVASMMKGKL